MNHRDGFIVAYVKDAGTQYIMHVQIYGASGEKIGDGKRFSNGTRVTPSIVGLSNDSILVAQMEDKAISSDLTVQIFDDNWEVLSERKTLKTNLRDPMAIVALSDGDFLVGVSPRHDDGYLNKIDLIRYSPKFKQVGSSVRITAYNGDIKQIVPLENGKALVTYEDNGRTMGQLLNP